MFENTNYSRAKLEDLYERVMLMMVLCSQLADEADKNHDYMLSLELAEAEKTLGKVYDELDYILHCK